jgi:hypothetical protein
MRTLDECFCDWEGHAFGFGYGSGEEHIIPALKSFFACAGVAAYAGDTTLPNAFDYRVLERELIPAVAWLLINALLRHDVEVLEYGSSPRHTWLTPHGERLKAYFDKKTAEELVDICTRSRPDGDICCYPTDCNCGPEGYQEGVKCQNPFWPRRN